ncbi:MAG TPA: hypothetical protein VJH03_05090 [Blastocatellia bacterium]|nr:hypothetical protein [Blastocatellia bacterium]
MVWIVVGVVLIAILVIASVGVALFWLVKSRYRDKKPPAGLSLDPARTPSKIGTCAKCGEQRVIVREDDSLCAFCYSSMRTKVLA